MRRWGLKMGQIDAPIDHAAAPGDAFEGQTVALTSETGRNAARPPFAEVSHALDELERRLHEGSGCSDDPHMKSALTALRTQLQAFARRKTRAAAPESETAAVEKSTAAQATFPFKSGLLSRLNPLAPIGQGSDQSMQGGDASILIDMQNDIAELARKLDNMCQGVAHPPTRKGETVRDGDIGRAEKAALSTASEHGSRSNAIEASETAIGDMTAHFDAARPEAPSRELADHLARDLPFSIANIDPLSAIERLEREIQAIGGRVETLGKPEIDPAAFARMQRQTEEIRASLAVLAARPPATEKIERQIATLTETLAKDLATRGPARIEILQGIEARLDALASKSDAATAKASESNHYDALSRHIEVTHRRLTARFEAGLAAASAETATLKDIVGALAEKIEAARDPKATDVAIKALERELAKVVQRLDGADKGFASLTSIEQTMGALFEQVEEIRRTASEAAEAARNAIRGGAEEGGPTSVGQRSSAPDHKSSLGREIADLRSLQEAAERRIHLTLTAVQETVGKVADRLAKLESELGEMRPGRLGSLLAPGLAPIFAPRSAPHPDEAGKGSAAGSREDGAERAMRAAGLLGDKGPSARNSESGPGAVELADFLIEPGSGFPHRRGASESRGPSASSMVPFNVEQRADRADFIAAARRAAQAAQKDALDAIQAIHAGSERAAAGDEPKSDAFRRARRFYGAHKRPLILSLAALCLVVGVYALARTMAHGKVDEFSPVFLKQLGKGFVHGNAAPPQSNPRVGDLPAAAPLVQPAAVREATPVLQNSFERLPPQALFGPPSGYAPAASETLATKSMSGGAPILIGALIDAFGRGDRRASAAAPLFWTIPPAAPLPAAANEDPRELAEAGDAAAQFKLGARYAEGQAGPQDLKSAAQWYEKAAQQGLAVAQYRLAKLYEKGLGVARNVARAENLYRAAAEQGNTRAMHNLGVLAAEGADGQPDYATAALWFGKAAEFGVRDSQFNVAVLLARGLGGPQNLVQAYAWFAILAAGGDAEAGRKRDEAGARLTASELAVAKVSAETFRPRLANQAANEVSPSPASLGVGPIGQIPDALKAKVSGL